MRIYTRRSTLSQKKSISRPLLYECVASAWAHCLWIRAVMCPTYYSRGSVASCCARDAAVHGLLSAGASTATAMQWCRVVGHQLWK
eukprot:195397-Pyramimonas_sp.AAC.1